MNTHSKKTIKVKLSSGKKVKWMLGEKKILVKDPIIKNLKSKILSI